MTHRVTSPVAGAPLRCRPADVLRLRDATRGQPRLAAQIIPPEWTRDGRLRDPRFLGLREDSAPEEVVRE